MRRKSSPPETPSERLVHELALGAVEFCTGSSSGVHGLYPNLGEIAGLGSRTARGGDMASNVRDLIAAPSQRGKARADASIAQSFLGARPSLSA